MGATDFDVLAVSSAEVLDHAHIRRTLASGVGGFRYCCIARRSSEMEDMEDMTAFPQATRHAGGLAAIGSAFAVALAVALTPQASGAEEPALPRISGPLADTPASRAFLAAAHQRRPLDLAARGYVEEEYLVSGDARVFAWPDEAGPGALARGPYTTRILIRRPRAGEAFNGAAIVEALNPSSPVDLPVMWAESYEHFIAAGFAWVGVTVKPNTIASLKRFDPERYAALAMPRPPSWPGCERDAINAWAQPTTPADETGLAWDMLSQIGALLKTRDVRNPLGGPVERLYLTGQSQTAGYARTYATVFARIVTGPDGGPLYDGYLYSGSPPWQVPLHQCMPGFAPGDARLITGPAGVPVIEIFAEGDMGTNIETRRPDSDTPPDLFRRYEVAGAAHTDPWEALSFPSAADMIRATGQEDAIADADCEPQNVEPSDFPVRYVFNAAWQNLDDWVRHGVPAPRAEPLELAPAADGPFHPERAFVTDRHGNARGGVRMPLMDVPTARWVGAKMGAFRCMFAGYTYPFDAGELRRLYPTPDDYVSQVRARAAALEAERWLTPADAAAIVRDAEQVRVP
jgi:hypothetical protein